MTRVVFVYDCRWSGDCDEKFIDDYNFVQDQVFRGPHTRERFQRQYLDNPYGPSVLVVVYLEGKPVAARGLWRNDIDGKPAYQPGQTCVMKECRGHGVFTEMTKRAVELLPKDVILYNFPNPNSFPGYIKMGWVNIKQYYLRFFRSSKQYDTEHPDMMDETYFNWWVKGRPDIKYMKRNGNYYLVRKYPRPFCYKVVAKVTKEIAITCNKAPLLVIYFFPSIHKTFYNKNTQPLRPVVRNKELNYVPLWKIDAI
ncbi:MAG: GNAT family N-acetyltransferase [Bacteroidaceae bacterium]|nr:GNAT family N-acetyltransferase [Bacteroidaceae bacterium]